MKRIMIMLLLLCALMATGAAEEIEDLCICSTLEDGTCSLDMLIEGYTGTTLVLPDQVRGKTVTRIDAGCLMELDPSVKEVVLPAGLMGISNSFYDDLDNVLVIADSVEKLTIQGEDSPFRVSDDGLLYLGTRLVGCVSGNTRKTAVIDEGTTEVSLQAFLMCSELESITIPASVQSIDLIGNVYYGTPEKLKAFDIAPENPVYQSEDGLLYKGGTLLCCAPGVTGDVLVRMGTTTIASGAFHNQDSVTSVVLPDGVITIEEGAFYSCGSLASVALPPSLCDFAQGAFSYCWRLKEIYLTNNLNYTCLDGQMLIDPEDGTLLLCAGGKQKVVIPETVVTVGKCAFTCNVTMMEVEIPDSVTALGREAFAFSQLRSIHIPQNVEKIGDAVFRYCEKLVSVTVDPYALGKTMSIPKNAFSGCISLTEVDLSKNVHIVRIGKEAFSHCMALKKVSLPQWLVAIDSFAFGECCSLLAIDLPEGLRRIGEFAFMSCLSLGEMEIPRSVGTVHTNSFMSCYADVYLPENTGIEGSTYGTEMTFVVVENSSASKACREIGLPYALALEHDRVNPQVLIADELRVTSCTDAQLQQLLEGGAKMTLRILMDVDVITGETLSRAADACLEVAIVTPDGKETLRTYPCALTLDVTSDGFNYGRQVKEYGVLSLADGVIAYSVSAKDVTFTTRGWAMKLEAE